MPYYSGWLLVLASWIGGAYLLTKWRGQDHITISKHAASTRGAYWFFMALLVTLGTAFYIWLVQYLAPQIPLQPLFATLLGLAILGQFGAAIFPDKPGWQRTVHTYAAWGMAVLYMPLSVLLLTATLPKGAWLAVLLCTAYLFVSWVPFLLGKLRGNRFLVFQATYIAVFQVALLVTAYA